MICGTSFRHSYPLSYRDKNRYVNWSLIMQFRKEKKESFPIVKDFCCKFSIHKNFAFFFLIDSLPNERRNHKEWNLWKSLCVRCLPLRRNQSPFSVSLLQCFIMFNRFVKTTVEKLWSQVGTLHWFFGILTLFYMGLQHHLWTEFSKKNRTLL